MLAFPDGREFELLLEERRFYASCDKFQRAGVGKPFYATHKFDRDARVFMLPFVLRWHDSQGRSKSDKKTLQSAIMQDLLSGTDERLSLYQRFPDLDPNHEKRKIGKGATEACVKVSDLSMKL